MVVVGGVPMPRQPGFALPTFAAPFPPLPPLGPGLRSPGIAQVAPLQQRPKLPPRPALPSRGLAPRASATAVPSQRSVGSRPALATTPAASSADPSPVLGLHVSQPIGNRSSIADAAQQHTRLSPVVAGLKGLPKVDASSAGDIIEAWLSVAGQMAAKDSPACSSGDAAVAVASAGPHVRATSSAAPAPLEAPPEVTKALLAAAATNQDSDENQIQSWLALAARNAVSVGEAELEALAEATAALPYPGSHEEQLPQTPLPPPEVSTSTATEIQAFLSAGKVSVPEDALARCLDAEAEAVAAAKESSARASQAAASVALAAKAAAAAAAVAVRTPLQPNSVKEALASDASANAELTGMEMLKAMAETREKEDAGESDSRPVAGYAMVSMMHRAAENAKRNMRSRMAEKLLSEPPSASAAKVSKQTEVPAFEAFAKLDEATQGASEQPPKEAGAMFLGSIPKGTGEGLILAECAKYGSVASIFYDPENVDMIEGAWALVTFSSQDSAAAAVRKMSRRSGLFGGTQSVEVRLGTPEDTARVEQHRVGPVVRPEAKEEEALAIDALPASRGSNVGDDAPAPPAEPERHREERKRDRRRDRSEDDDRDRRGRRGRDRRDRGRRRDDRSRRRRRDSRSRSRAETSEASESSREDAKASKGAITPVVPVEKKARGLGGFGETPAPDTARILSSGAAAPDEPSGGRQVGCRGSWAEFATPDNRSYYVNVLTGEKQWLKPVVYDNTASQRGGKGTSTTGHSNLYFGSLPAGINDVTFRQLVQQYGTIISIKVVPEAYYAFAKFARVEEAQAAINGLNGNVLAGSQLQVRFANMDRAW